MESHHAKTSPRQAELETPGSSLSETSEFQVLFKFSVISANGRIAFTRDTDVHMAYFLH